MPELPKTYSPKDHERRIYERWLASGFFNPDQLPDAKKRKPFVISMPPPNITGDLHIGHALGMTIQDILTRYHRMRGRAALWLPGTDHAAIATQVVVDRELRKEGVDRFKLGREKFVERVWEWKKTYGSKIVRQIQSLGASADWSRERFTMDDEATAAVNHAFKKLYDDGLIYRGERIVNWCPDCQTSISDLEVDHQDVPGKLWYLRYSLASGQGTITVATTRPETMLGDTAVAVNPTDERYRHLVGQDIRLPITNRLIPIIADSRVEKDFGTGAVKVTPGHDPLDFDLGQTHHLPILTVIGKDGRMIEPAPEHYVGLDVAGARQVILAALRDDGILEREEDHIHSVGFCSRSKTIIEPLVSLQWFIRTQPLAKKAIAAVKRQKIVIEPARFAKTYFHWMDNIRDWNISRQIWWGHRLPVWYKTDERGNQVMKVSAASPGAGWVQDEDTLDTWFSSGLWTFSTLGWPKHTADLKRFHPTDMMVTGWDILFFWIARMVMFSEYFLGEVPFKTVYITGLILDAEGKKMSKSKGTGVDPLVISDRYGTDALRLSLVIGNAPGQDFKYSDQRAEMYRNFVNKLWNVARYILAKPRPGERVRPSSLADEWVLHQCDRTIAAVTASIERCDFSAAGGALYTFVWHDFADWYLEASKLHLNTGVLYHVLETVLGLLHPFAPFVTEAIWSELHPEALLMVAPWPKPSRQKRGASAQHFARLQKTVVALRNFRAHVGNELEIQGKYVDGHRAPLDAELLSALSRVPVALEDRLDVVGGFATIHLADIEFQFPEAAVRQYDAWRTKERADLERYITSLKNKLADESFVRRAPGDIVQQEQQKLREAEERLLEL